MVRKPGEIFTDTGYDDPKNDDEAFVASLYEKEAQIPVADRAAVQAKLNRLKQGSTLRLGYMTWAGNIDTKIGRLPEDR